MGRRNDNTRIELKTLAIEAAEDIIKKEGYTNLSTRKIATAIGYTVGTLYNVFENLDDLVIQVNVRTLEKINIAIEQALMAKKDEECEVRLIARAYMNFSRTEPKLFESLNAVGATIGRLPEEVQKVVERQFEFMINAIAKKAQLNQTDALKANLLFWVGLYGIAELARKNRLQTLASGFNIDDLVNLHVKTFLGGLKVSSIAS